MTFIKIYISDTLRNTSSRYMKYFGAFFLVILVCVIMVGGNYSRQEVVQTAIQLIPTPSAQPELVESTLAVYNGIHSVHLSRMDHKLHVTYNRARISFDDLCHLLNSLGYQTSQAKPVRAGAGM
ncbi:MAG: hypothetical protein JSW54_08215 [Fidelibacterota bacterium]|nr:MAG: hypothetical protein JSW54_08215 [Candidatus Neomarinimicrobiota bacterium]